jgi:tetratricopeptide (TPR) repeat protein
MNFDENEKAVIQKHLADPADAHNLAALSSLYWTGILKSINVLINEKKDIAVFIQNERPYIDAGIAAELLGDQYQSMVDKLNKETISYKHLKISPVSAWLQETIRIVLQGDRKELLERDIRREQSDLLKLKKEAAGLQEARKTSLLQDLTADPACQTDQTLYHQIDKLIETDRLSLQLMKIKKAVAHGSYLSPEERRTHAQRETQVKKDKWQYEALVNRIHNLNGRKTLHDIDVKLEKLFVEILDKEGEIEKHRQSIQSIEAKQNTISAVEMEDRLSREWEYLRDLVKLAAKRIHSESLPLLVKPDPFFTQAEAAACFDRILEFDPRVFHNEHASAFGVPSVVLVPGAGNALFDWKYNQFIIPLSPPGANFLGSIANAIVEYRLDVDGEKNLINSFWKMDENKDLKSIFQIKNKFVKDYIAWIVSESKGYKVMDKEVRKWFEYEIAPSRTEIYTPPGLTTFAMSPQQYANLQKEITARLEKEGDSAPDDDFWTASIIAYQQGKFSECHDYLITFLNKNPDHIFGYYNLGFVSIKAGRKPEAIRGFGEFIKRNPQSWWASVANDYLRKLQMV